MPDLLMWGPEPVRAVLVGKSQVHSAAKLDTADADFKSAARSAGLNWLAGAGAGPASQCQPPAVASSLQPPAGLQTFKKWRQSIVVHADFKFSNSNYHAFVDHAVLQFQPRI